MNGFSKYTIFIAYLRFLPVSTIVHMGNYNE